MSYILVKPEVLEKIGMKHFNRMPDGRAIADISTIRVLSDVENIQLVSSDEELDKLRGMQKLKNNRK